MRRLERYVLGEHLLPFLLGFSVVTLVIILDFLFDYLDLIVGKGIPPMIVLKLFLLALGWITVLSFPCGVLVACLMTFGRLAQDNEITALRACGVHLGRILLPVLLGAAGLAGLLTLFNNYVLPETNHAFATLSLAIHRKAPTAVIREGVFNNDFPDKSLLVGAVNNRTGGLKDITLYDFSGGDIPVTVLARRGQLRWSEDGSTLRLDLEDGEIHEVPTEGDARQYRRLRFDHHTVFLHNAGATLEIPQRESRSEREMGLARLNREIGRLSTSYRQRAGILNAELDSLGVGSYDDFVRLALPVRSGGAGALAGAGAFWRTLIGRGPGRERLHIPDAEKDRLLVRHSELMSLKKKISSYSVEVHKKFSIPFACIVFVLLGAPLGMRARRGGLATSAISIVFILVYYMFLIGGEQLADRAVVSPAVAMWMPNVVFGLPGLWMTWQAMRGAGERG